MPAISFSLLPLGEGVRRTDEGSRAWPAPTSVENTTANRAFHFF
jgi:hypothetical protein